MPLEIQSAWIQVLGGGFSAILCVFLGFFIARRFDKRDKSKTKVIQSSYSRVPIVNPKQIGPLTVSVDKQFLTNQDADKGVIMPVNIAYTFNINITNVGTEDIENAEIDIAFSDKSSIVQMASTSSDIPIDKVVHTRDTSRPNFARITMPYINKQSRLNVSVLTVENSSGSCQIDVNGVGIQHQRGEYVNVTRTRRSSERFGIYINIVSGLLITISIFVTVLLYIAGNDRNGIISPISIQQTDISILRSTVQAIQDNPPTSTITVSPSVTPTNTK